MKVVSWDEARARVHGATTALPAVTVRFDEADGATLATPIVTLTDLPAFDTSSVDGYAVAGPSPWQIVARLLAGQTAEDSVAPGTAVEIATGAMVPPGTEHVLRVEHTTVDGDSVSGDLPTKREWRTAGEEAAAGDVLIPAGATVTPGVLALAASCGHDVLRVARRPRVAVRIFGDELLTAGPPGDGRVRDSLGPSLPGWLRRLGVDVEPVVHVEDTLDAHVAAIEEAAAKSDVVVTTGGTMHGPVDHLHPALVALGAEYVVDTVAVRPGFPMLLARLPGGQWLLGLPGNPQSAVIGLVSLGVPLFAGLEGAPLPELPRALLAVDVPGRGDFTHLALARLGPEGAETLPHAGSAMMRGVAVADGFIVVRPGEQALAGGIADLVPLPR
jgi:molybdopterin molybdotransferase